MMCAEQIVLNECDVAAISNRGLSRAPEKGQLKPRVFFNDVAQAGLKLGDGNVLRVNAPQDLATEGPLVWRAVWDAPSSLA